MERDILRRTHNIFSTMKDESINKYQDQDTNISFVDENTLKYQNMIKKMEERGGSKKIGSSGDSDDSDNNEEELNSQNTIITTNVKHVGKGVVIQSYDISDDDEDGDDDEDDEDGEDGEDGKDDEGSSNSKKFTNTSMVTSITMTTLKSTNYNPNKKIVYESENNINVDDI